MTHNLLTEEFNQGQYANHLARANDSREILATTDIVNDRGVLLLRAGKRVSREAAAQLVRHKLLRPLEEQIGVDGALTDQGLLAALHAALKDYPDLCDLYASAGRDEQLAVYARACRNYPLILQKLTILSDVLPDVFHKSLICSWLAAQIALEMGLPAGECEAAFLAGLTRDLGMLHIDPAKVCGSDWVDAAGWRTIQAHTVAGSFILDGIPNPNRLAVRAVLEHHERCDGSGYPRGLVGASIHPVSLVVGLADGLQAIRTGLFKRLGFSLGDCRTYLRMNQGLFSADVCSAVIRLLDAAQLQVTQLTPAGGTKAYAEDVRAKNRHLGEIVEPLARLRDWTVQAVCSLDPQAALCRVPERVCKLFDSSGLFRPEIEAWLRDVSDDACATEVHDLDNIALMQAELIWQLRDVLRCLQTEVDTRTKVSSSTDLSILEAAEAVARCLGSVGVEEAKVVHAGLLLRLRAGATPAERPAA